MNGIEEPAESQAIFERDLADFRALDPRLRAIGGPAVDDHDLVREVAYVFSDRPYGALQESETVVGVEEELRGMLRRSFFVDERVDRGRQRF